MSKQFELLLLGCAHLGIDLSEVQQMHFRCYEGEILRWSPRVHLVSPQDCSRLATRHILDSLALQQVVTLHEGDSLADVGSGAGFPGIPLAIGRPDLNVTVIESNRKKGLFLRHIMEMLSLKNVRVVIDRVESLIEDEAEREQYEWSTVRAVTALRGIIPWTLPLLKPLGRLLAYKGPDPSVEIEDARQVMSQWHCEIEGVRRIMLPELPIVSTIVVVRKQQEESVEHGSRSEDERRG